VINPALLAIGLANCIAQSDKIVLVICVRLKLALGRKRQRHFLRKLAERKIVKSRTQIFSKTFRGIFAFFQVSVHDVLFDSRQEIMAAVAGLKMCLICDILRA